MNQNLQHSQKPINLDKYDQFKLESEAKTNVINASFQELLLKKISRNDPPKTKKKRITKGAEGMEALIEWKRNKKRNK